ncbi:DeoR/GlpR family DNA-binding transcription regulator [Paenarthrobacter sp. NPDC089714]|uniref:DeoR/GlpR family DNA-binding transcription regulator n=1 Tax=Paenarthrobacter sp. NPDC089714 TaxID=3364377 RepID=UPI0037F2A883
MTGLRYGSAPDRRERILALVEEQGFCSTTELVKALGVSDMTVRRDTQRMADKGLVRIVHGGVSVLPPSALEGSGDYEVRGPLMAEAKQALGRWAARHIGPGETFGLDAGTTLLEVARALPATQPYTMVTHSAPAIAEVMHNRAAQVLCLGGDLHHDTLSFAGTQTLEAISQLMIPTLYLAASGIGERGIFCANDFDAITKRALIEVSDRVILVADSSKFASTAMVRVCGLDQIDQIIVDEKITEEDAQKLQDHHVTISIVPLNATARYLNPAQASAFTTIPDNAVWRTS